MNFFCPQGIGDSLWALHKIRAVALAHGADAIHLYLSSSEDTEIQSRALPFLRRFPFLASANLLNRQCVRHPEKPLTVEGYWDYLPDGFIPGTDLFALMPNAVLERGVRLEDWLPEYPIDWDTMTAFAFTQEERRYAERLHDNLGPYVVFYPGPEAGNTTSGHNRGGLWSPAQWAELGGELRRRGYQIVVVGAAYDRSYWERYLRPLARGWHDFLGRWQIGTTLAVLQRANLTVAYQSGIGICAHYLGTPTVQWWRAKGDSLHAGNFCSFEESMSHCWANPVGRERYLPLIYGRSGVADVLAFEQEKVL